ncbi:MAG TPA: HAMP domain-containing sensor histidine kinase [Planctomycetaceae bacterium]|nr:HAMP domain-containing sensor histidine kinase [Planctomycetaceae bacterium]
MWWPIRNQILVPFAGLLLACVAVISVTAAVLAARRAEQATVAGLNQVIETLGRSSFPLHAASVLERMKGLSGAEFVAFGADGQALAATLPQPPALSRELQRAARDELSSLHEYALVELGGARYFAGTIRPLDPAGRVRHLLVLYPVASLDEARWQAALPPLAVGTVTLVLAVIVSAWLAQRISRRLRTVEQQVAGIAAGRFDEVALGSRHDEIQDLVRSVNQMSRQLQDMQATIHSSERTRLLGQLAGGLAHQLRNALTGARLAVQIHRRRCELNGEDESLEVALRQLSLTEEQVKGLLSLGRTERRPPAARPAGDVVDDVAALVGPACRHAGVELATSITGGAGASVADSESVRTAVLNLTLNAIEAAGRGGRVEINATVDGAGLHFEIVDDGPGPPPELGEAIFDVFVTSKPEGVGLGLALARQIAEESDGGLSWQRVDCTTRFRLSVPASRQLSPQNRNGT